MILTSLEMQGFKSFPEKTVLTFGKGITAVVGPNGSGKSNISDAVRWVLGEQSSKSLRGSKMEDVIFDGTKIRKAHGFAQVTLRLDNRDRSIKGADTDEVAVTRRYYRSGESEYKINGVNVRLRDVHELFMDTGLGRDGYSMVSQGKIADMVSGKGKECRDMLEEAAGISSYRYRRNDSLKKLGQAEDNLVRLRDILTELESRIGPLKHQSEKAQKFLVLAEEKKELEIGLWLHNIDKIRDELRKQEDNISIASGHYTQTEEELAEIERMIEKSIADTQNINIKIDEIRQGISLLEEKAANAGSEQAVLRNSIEHNNETIERISRDRYDSESSQNQLLKEIENEKKLIQQIKNIRDEKNSELENVNAELDRMQSESGSLLDESNEIARTVALLAKELADCRVAVSTALSSIGEIKARVEVIDSLIAQRQETVDSLSAEKSRSEKALSDCEKEIEELTNSVEGYTLRFKNKDAKADTLKKELDEKAFEAQRVTSKIKMLEELEKSMEGYSGAVKKVIKESEKGALRGIHGTLSQLISVKEEYTVAIETALGNAVQNIVTETENDAKAAINYLKSSNAGRATFQPVSSVKGKCLQ
ncbi:MAG: AAA family ATPase, partial [Clostridia bacterium]|nr:AAA family ATPase [Clostridia bacterium]